jgi:hypothetical protein
VDKSVASHRTWKRFHRFWDIRFPRNHKEGWDDVSESNVEQWLDSDDGEPDYQILSQEIESVLQAKEEDDDVVEEESASSCPELSVIRNLMGDVISYIGVSSDLELLACYGHLRQFYSSIIKKQHASRKQMKIDSFFQPTHSQ